MYSCFLDRERKIIMAFDALVVGCIADELEKNILGSRIDKIHQPERDEITLHIRSVGSSSTLLISVGAAHPRINFTEKQKQNPISAPLFCMLLRKHIGGGKVTKVEQIDFERIISIHIESRNELGDLTEKQLIIEIMGRHSNIILVSESGKIIDAIKHVDLSVSSMRQVLPGLMYEYPPRQSKTPLTDFDGDFDTDLPQGELISKAVMSKISGISPLTAREIVYRAYGEATLKISEIDNFDKLSCEMKKLSEDVKCRRFSPCIIFDEKAQKIVEFSAMSIEQYGSMMKIQQKESISSVIDEFYSKKDSLERMKQKSADIVKLLGNLLERAYKKRIILKQTISDAQKKDTYKIYGDLIAANIYLVHDGDKELAAVNFYDPNGETVKIPLDASLTPSQNSQRYYKKYRKSKTAETEATIQEKQNEENIEYLESTLAAVENCTCEADINAIRSELSETGYIKRNTKNKKNKQASSSKPLHFISPDGFDIYVGKNNTQNDYLTLKLANSNDIWFHTKQIHGSHTIIKLKTDKNVPQETMLMAAQLAAYYSKGRNSNQVPVDYTFIKNVKKPSGAKPGMVIYDGYNTVYVTPKKYEDEEV